MLKNPALITAILLVALSAIVVSSAPPRETTSQRSSAISLPTARASDSVTPNIHSSRSNDSLSEPIASAARSSAQEQSTTSKADIETSTSSEPIDFTSYKNTSTFTCDGKITGYYADVKLNCHVYHFCTQLDGVDGPSYQRMSYMCLDDSLFDQGDLNCVSRADLKVSCHNAEAHYEKSNKQFDAREESQPSMSDNLAANLMMNPIARFIAGR